MPTKGQAGNSFDDAQGRDEGGIGDADNVQKTSYVTGKGTDPNAQRRKGEVVASVGSGGGINVLGWAVGLVAVLVGLVYLIGVVR